MANVLSSNELRNGTVYLDGTDVLKVLDYKHQKYGRGQATIRVKVKNIYTGSISEKTYDSGAKFPEAETAKRNVQYMYKDQSAAYFMDGQDFSQFSLPVSDIEQELGFLKEGANVVALFVSSDPVSIEVPKTVELKVVESPDAVAGDTATNVYKKVILETGLQTDAPLFVKAGDILKINTESNSYVSRV